MQTTRRLNSCLYNRDCQLNKEGCLLYRNVLSYSKMHQLSFNPNCSSYLGIFFIMQSLFVYYDLYGMQVQRKNLIYKPHLRHVFNVIKLFRRKSRCREPILHRGLYRQFVRGILLRKILLSVRTCQLHSFRYGSFKSFKGIWERLNLLKLCQFFTFLEAIRNVLNPLPFEPIMQMF